MRVKPIIYIWQEMSFFNKLFGGGEKPKAPKTAAAPPQPKLDSVEEKKLKIEKASVTLDAKINDFEDKEKKLENKVDFLKRKAKEALEVGNKKEAKKYVEDATRIQKQIEVIF